MGCAPIIGDGGRVVGHVCRSGRTFYLPRRAKAFWCFGCRAYMVHLWKVLVAEWYDPELLIECVGCGRDDTRFPGW